MGIYYGVYGRTGVGVFTAWNKAKAARDGMLSGNCKKFKTRFEAEEWTILRFNELHGWEILKLDFYQNEHAELDQLIELRFPYGRLTENHSSSMYNPVTIQAQANKLITRRGNHERENHPGLHGRSSKRRGPAHSSRVYSASGSDPQGAGADMKRAVIYCRTNTIEDTQLNPERT